MPVWVTCDHCGALVADTTRHDGWHVLTSTDTVPPPPPPPILTPPKGR